MIIKTSFIQSEIELDYTQLIKVFEAHGVTPLHYCLCVIKKGDKFAAYIADTYNCGLGDNEFTFFLHKYMLSQELDGFRQIHPDTIYIRKANGTIAVVHPVAIPPENEDVQIDIKELSGA